MKQLKFLILGILFLVAGFLLGQGFPIQPATTREAHEVQLERKASVMVDTGAELFGFSELSIGEGDTVWSLLERIAQEREELSVSSTDYGDLGILIERINGYENGSSNQYWQYWVNNEYADVAANQYAVRPGDAIMWKFPSSLFQNL